MASRFWVGGTGNWDAVTTTNWSATSGGSGGQSVPTTSDTVTFDASSGGGTVTGTATMNMSSFTGGAFTGTFNTNGQALNCVGTFNYGGSATRTLTLGASTLTVGAISIATITGLTFNANTSTIIVNTASTFFIAAAGLTFNAVQLITGNGNFTINGSNTFATLTRTGTAAKTDILTLGGDQTVTGTLTINGNSAINRMYVKSDTPGTTRTLTAAIVVVTYADFQDITGAGAGSWNLSAITGLSGNCGGNSGITFTTQITNFWVSGTGNWSDSTKWKTTSGGAGAGRVPLPQDTAQFDSNSFTAGSQVVTQDMPRIGIVSWTNPSNTPEFTTSTVASVFGSFTLTSGMTLTASTQPYTFEGRGVNTLTMSTKTWAKNIIFECFGGSYALQDAFTSSFLTVLSGTLNANNVNVTCPTFGSTGSRTRAVVMGSGTWEINGDAGNLWIVQATGLTLTANTSTIRLTGALTGNRFFQGGGQTYNNFDNSTTGAFTLGFTGSNTFNDFKINAVSAARTVLFTAATTQTMASMSRDVGGTNIITINSTTTGTHALVKTGGGTISLDYLNIQHSVATPATTWYAGTHSTDNQAVATAGSGWIFTDPPAGASTGNFLGFF